MPSKHCSKHGNDLGCVLWIPQRIEIKNDDIISKVICSQCCKIVIHLTEDKIQSLVQDIQDFDEQSTLAADTSTVTIAKTKNSKDTFESHKKKQMESLPVEEAESDNFDCLCPYNCNEKKTEIKSSLIIVKTSNDSLKTKVAACTAQSETIENNNSYERSISHEYPPDPPNDGLKRKATECIVRNNNNSEPSTNRENPFNDGLKRKVAVSTAPLGTVQDNNSSGPSTSREYPSDRPNDGLKRKAAVCTAQSRTVQDDNCSKPSTSREYPFYPSNDIQDSSKPSTSYACPPDPITAEQRRSRKRTANQIKRKYGIKGRRTSVGLIKKFRDFHCKYCRKPFKRELLLMLHIRNRECRTKRTVSSASVTSGENSSDSDIQISDTINVTVASETNRANDSNNASTGISRSNNIVTNSSTETIFNLIRTAESNADPNSEERSDSNLNNILNSEEVNLPLIMYLLRAAADREMLKMEAEE